MLVNDPPVPDPAKPGELDSKTFGGKAMTYYGRWTYKYEIAAQKGAAGALIIHETVPAGYGFNVVQGKTGEQFDLVTPDKNMSRAAIEGWISLDQAKKLLQSAGQDFDKLKASAATRDFQPVALGTTASMTIKNTLRTIDSKNVIAKLEGSDPQLKDEYIVYTAHWDHFGKGPEGIFHGAEDDGIGCAALIEMARAYTRLPAPPKRSILFLAVTSEEQGLLGSQYYATTPIYPMAKTLADMNMDSWNVHGRTKDMTLTGFGASELDDYAQTAAAEQGRVVHGDAEPEKGFYYRSDHFNFAKEGVPALDPGAGTDYIGKPADYGQTTGEEMIALSKKHTLFEWSAQSKVDPIPVARAKGIYFWTPEGKRFIDFNSQLMCVNIGHGDERVIRAIHEQASVLAYANPFMATEARARLGAKLAEITPGDIDTFFFTNGGAEANENAIKIARFFTGRHKIMARYRSYHGATAGALSPTGDPRRWAAEPGIPGVVRVLDPYHGIERGWESAENSLAMIEETMQLEGPQTIAAFILETVVGTNGILVPPDGYLQGVRKLCDKYGILMIADEVMAGFGRTGEWFAVDHWKVVPDLISMAKGLTSSYLPLGAVGMRHHIAQHFQDKVFYGGLT